MARQATFVLVALLLSFASKAVLSGSECAMQPLSFDGGSPGNALWDYFLQHNSGPVAHKWHNFFDVYHRYFQRFRDVPINFLEIGVQSGGSLGMWRSYFRHPDTKFYGMDINPYCKLFEEVYPGVQVFIGSQSNRTFLREFVQRTPKFDIILDDAGHTMEQQIVGFEELYNHVKTDGIYMVEDCQSSYQANYGGMLNPPNHTATFMAYSKRLVDRLHYGYLGKTNTVQQKLELQQHGPPEFTLNTLSVAYYDQIVVFERGRRPLAASHSKHGTFSMPYNVVAKFDHAQMQKYRDMLAGSGSG